VSGVVGGGGLKGPGEDGRVEGFRCWGGDEGGQGFGWPVKESGGGGRVRVGGRVGWRAKGDGKGTYPFRRPGPGSRARRASRGAAECTIEPLGRRGIDWATGVAMGRRCMRRRKVTEWAKFEVFPSRTSTAVKKMMHGERESGLYTLPFPSLRPLRPKPHTTTPASKRLRETSLPWPLKT